MGEKAGPFANNAIDLESEADEGSWDDALRRPAPGKVPGTDATESKGGSETDKIMQAARVWAAEQKPIQFPYLSETNGSSTTTDRFVLGMVSVLEILDKLPAGLTDSYSENIGDEPLYYHYKVNFGLLRTAAMDPFFAYEPPWSEGETEEEQRENRKNSLQLKKARLKIVLGEHKDVPLEGDRSGAIELMVDMLVRGSAASEAANKYGKRTVHPAVAKANKAK